MDPVLVGWLTTGLVLILLALGVPIAFAMATCGILGWLMIGGMIPALALGSIVAFSKTSAFEYSVIALFILMGYVVFYAGIGADLYKTARSWIGHLPGGLSLATVVACGAFAAASGSSIASAASMGRIAVPEMLKVNYDKRLAAGCVAAGGTLAAMIPPSVDMVLYGIIVEQSIGKLLIGGILPGLLEIALYSIMIVFWVKRSPSIAPLAPSATWKVRFTSLKPTWPILVVATAVIGGIYTGVFTPTEAGAIGASAAFIVGLSSRRLGWKGIKAALLEAIRTSAMIFAMIIGVFMFSYQFGVSHIPEIISEFLVGLPVHPLLVMSGIYVLMLILGSFLGTLPMFFLTLPFVFPAVVALGFDPIWFGIIMVHLSEVAVITPPFCLNVYALAGAVPEVGVPVILRGIWRFLIMDIVMLAILTAFPQIATFLPSLMD